MSDDPLKTTHKSSQDENLVETVALLARRFSKFRSKFYKKSEGFRAKENKNLIAPSTTAQDLLVLLIL